MPENFIESYLTHTKKYESPNSFWKWSAYSTISTVLRDKCYIRNGDSLLFPNLYILLLAESGGRKNRPVELSEQLTINIPGIKTLSGHASVQGILDDLARTETDPNTGKVLKSSSATVFAPEFAAALSPDPQGMKILTDLYDYKPNTYKNRLRTGPSFDLEKIVLSIFAASNPDMLTTLFDQAVIRGGFLARTLLITPNEFRPANALIRNDDAETARLKQSLDILKQMLRKVAQVTGEFKFEEAAVDEYEKWYVDFRQDYLRRKEITGVIGRIHTHILKLAMVFAANELTLCIKKKYIEQSIEECLSLIKNYSIFTMNHAKTEIGTVGGTILTSLLAAKNSNYMLSRKVIIRDNWQNFDVDLLDKAVIALEAAQMLVQHQMKDGIYYQLTKQCLEMLQ